LRACDGAHEGEYYIPAACRAFWRVVAVHLAVADWCRAKSKHRFCRL